MKNRTNIRWLTQLALLVAILLVLNYTPLGYLQIGPLSASLLTVPVKLRLERLFTVVPLLFTVTVTRRPVEKALPSW